MLYDFWNKISADPRITMRHIGLYAALLCLSQKMGFTSPLTVYSFEAMEAAKITARWSYCQYIRELHEFGYIRYEPSFKKNQPSKIYFVNF